MRDEVVEKDSLWQHFKGDTMRVIGLAKNSETLETMVVYEHAQEIWVRPISSFLSDEDVSERSDNRTHQKYRFVKKKG